MKKRKYKASARHFGANIDTDESLLLNEEQQPEESREERRSRLKRPDRSRFSADEGTSRKPRLRFEARKQRLRYTEAELRSEPLLLEGDVIGDTLEPGENSPFKKAFEDKSNAKRSKFHASKNQVGQAVDETMDNLSQQSDNEGVQMGNMHRKKAAKGLSEGLRRGRRWRSGHSDRAARREVKRENRLKVREVRENAYEQRHGKPPLKAQARKKLQQKKAQLKKAAEKKLGRETVNLIEQIVRIAVRTIAATVRAVIAFIAAPVAGVVLVYGAILIIAMYAGGALLGTTTTIISSYTAEGTAIEAASSYYTKLEAELEKKIRDIPSSWEWAHIDEFRYDLDPIGHDPYEIMAYLNVTYPGFSKNPQGPGEFGMDAVQRELDYIFDCRYELILDEEIQIRFYEESYVDDEGNDHTEIIEYPYYILHVTLNAKEQEPILLDELRRTPADELDQWYTALQETQGARQEVANPFGTYDWRGNISCLYGWRIDPIGGVGLQMHHGLDIAMPRGTPIFAGIDGRVTHTGSDSVMGNYIILEDDNGKTVKYGHCDSISVPAGFTVKKGGSVIGTVGNTGQSTGAHLHIEILENGQYLDPVYSLGYTPDI